MAVQWYQVCRSCGRRSFMGSGNEGLETAKENERCLACASRDLIIENSWGYSRPRERDRRA